jgi:hypothetical protein
MCGECEQTLGEASATNNAQEAREKGIFNPVWPEPLTDGSGYEIASFIF